MPDPDQGVYDHARGYFHPYHINSRRSLFGAVALSGDGDLITVCAEFDALERKIKALYAPGSGSSEAERDAAEAPLKAAQQPLLNRLCTMKATTPAGCIARAKTLALWDGGVEFGEDDPDDYADDRMMAALVRDLAAMGAAA